MRTNYPFLLHIATLTPLALVLGGLWLYFGSETATVQFFDACRLQHPALTWFFLILTSVGNALFYPVYGYFFWLGVRRNRPELAHLAVAYVVAQAVVAVIFARVVKFSIGRPRPMTGGPFMPLAWDSAHHSFPSGHTTEAIGASLPLIQRYRAAGLTVALSLFIAVMGFSRIYMSMHFLSDVVGGMVMGSISGYLSWRFVHLPLYWWRRWVPARIREKFTI